MQAKLSAVLSSIPLLAACGSPARGGSHCALDSDCAVGERCVFGECAVECRDTRDCATGLVCDTVRAQCIPAGLPSNDAGGPDDDSGSRAAAETEGGGGALDLPGTLPLAGGPGDDWRPSTEMILRCGFIPQANPPLYGHWATTRICGPTSLTIATSCLSMATPTVADLRALDAWMGIHVDAYEPLPDLDGDYTDVSDLVEAASGFFGATANATNLLELADIYAELVALRPVVVAVETQCQADATGACRNNAPADVMRRGDAHFAVVVGITTTHIVLHDPGRSGANGAFRRYTIGSFAAVWSRHGRWAIAFAPPSPCTDSCGPEGSRSCADMTTQQECRRGADGCLSAVPLLACDACAAGVCCTHGCPIEGATRCEGGVASTCAAPAGTACRSWTDVACALGCDGPRCASGACSPGDTRTCVGPTGVPGTQACSASRAWGDCVGVEVCNGVDDDRNGIVDDPPGCWTTIYRHRTDRGWALETRCWSTSSTPAVACAGFVSERDAFVLATAGGPDRFELSQCSSPPGADGVSLDHVLVPRGSADYMALLGDGFSCGSLGWAYTPTTSSVSTPFAAARLCPLWRWRYWATPGIGAHLFSATDERTTSLICEAPARAQVVVLSGSCFPGTPPGC